MRGGRSSPEPTSVPGVEGTVMKHTGVAAETLKPVTSESPHPENLMWGEPLGRPVWGGCQESTGGGLYQRIWEATVSWPHPLCPITQPHRPISLTGNCSLPPGAAGLGGQRGAAPVCPQSSDSHGHVHSVVWTQLWTCLLQWLFHVRIDNEEENMQAFWLPLWGNKCLTLLSSPSVQWTIQRRPYRIIKMQETSY